MGISESFTAPELQNRIQNTKSYYIHHIYIHHTFIPDDDLRISRNVE